MRLNDSSISHESSQFSNFSLQYSQNVFLFICAKTLKKNILKSDRTIFEEIQNTGTLYSTEPQMPWILKKRNGCTARLRYQLGSERWYLARLISITLLSHSSFSVMLKWSLFWGPISDELFGFLGQDSFFTDLGYWGVIYFSYQFEMEKSGFGHKKWWTFDII